MSSNNYDEERRTEGAASNAEDSSALSAHQQYLGDVGDGLPEGPVIDLTEPLPEGLKKEDVITFGNYYRSHSEVGNLLGIDCVILHKAWIDVGFIQAFLNVVSVMV